MCGAQSLMGSPGKPAPEPRSATRGRARSLTTEGTEASLRAGMEEALGNKWRAANRLSPKWRVTISSGWRMEVRLMRAFQRTSISMYVDIHCSWNGERRRGFSPAFAGSEGHGSDEIAAWVEIPRKGWSSSAIRAWFIGNEIVE